MLGKRVVLIGLTLVSLVAIVYLWKALLRQPVYQKVSPEELRQFSHQFALALSKGMNVSQALLWVADQTTDPYFKQVILDVHSTALAGLPLSEAMAKHPEAFDVDYVAAIRQGERIGRIDLMLQQLSQR